jgi:hypothetical protein
MTKGHGSKIQKYIKLIKYYQLCTCFPLWTKQGIRKELNGTRVIDPLRMRDLETDITTSLDVFSLTPSHLPSFVPSFFFFDSFIELYFIYHKPG